MGKAMYKEIGSDFWLNKFDSLTEEKICLDFLKIKTMDTVFLSSGRSAISFVLKNIEVQDKRKVALLPPFTCHTVIEPFINAGYTVYYYRIDKSLSFTSDSLLEDIEKLRPTVILLHSYFGFNTVSSATEVIKKIKNEQITIIEDITQNLYSGFSHLNADYFIWSFRKWTALPDGGSAVSTGQEFSFLPEEIDLKLSEMKTEAFHAKYLYMTENSGEKSEFLKLLKEAEQALDAQQSIYAMSKTSQRIQAGLDIDSLVKKRRENFLTLSAGLSHSKLIEPVFSSLDENVTPLYFPVYVNKNRYEFQRHLIEKNIFAPIVWPKPIFDEGEICEDAQWVYEHILSIPCDQRYGKDEMEYIMESIHSYKD